MPLLELSREADADLVGMLEYGAEHYEWGVAEAYVASFDEGFRLILDYPQIGAIHPNVRPPIRSWPHLSHRIFYDIDGDIIRVRRILHKSADAVRWLR